MEQIVPLISTSTVGPLGIKHLPRLWLKLLLHAKGRLPEGYRHGTGGLDEQTLQNFGVDRDSFIRFITTEMPTYTECEVWFRKHASKLDPDSIAKHNEIASRDKPERLAAAQRDFIGYDDPSLRNAVLLNDLDDWMTFHALVTTGALPPPNVSSLNAIFSELLKELLDQTHASRTTIRLDLPELGMEPSKPAAEAKRPEIMSIMDKIRRDQDKSGTLNFLKRERRLLIQDDLLNPDPAAIPPRDLIDVFGTYAQMLGPIVRADRVVAYVSVHENTGARHWKDEDVRALETTIACAGEIIDAVLANRRTPSMSAG